MKPKMYSEPKHNQLLAALQPDEYDALLPTLEPIRLKLGQVMFSEDDPIDSMVFITMGAASIRAVAGANEVELALVGTEGLIGLLLIINSAALYKAVMLSSGEGYCLSSKHVARHARRRTPLAAIVRSYAGFTTRTLARGAICACSHTIEQRLAKWLLEMRDHEHDASLAITHEMISKTLCVRRASVSEALQRLESRRVLSHRRGGVTIIDDRVLESIACSCYRYVSEQTERFLKSLTARNGGT